MKVNVKVKVRKLMVNLTLVTDQLFLNTIRITSLGQQYLHSAKLKLKYKELCSSIKIIKQLK